MKKIYMILIFNTLFSCASANINDNVISIPISYMVTGPEGLLQGQYHNTTISFQINGLDKPAGVITKALTFNSDGFITRAIEYENKTESIRTDYIYHDHILHSWKTKSEEINQTAEKNYGPDSILIDLTDNGIFSTRIILTRKSDCLFRKENFYRDKKEDTRPNLTRPYVKNDYIANESGRIIEFHELAFDNDEVIGRFEYFYSSSGIDKIFTYWGEKLESTISFIYAAGGMLASIDFSNQQ